MKLLYLNNELAVSDGCNAHALGMLNAMKRIIGKENIYAFPAPKDCSAKQDNKKLLEIKDNFGALLQVIRYYRKSIKSITLANRIYRDIQKQKFYPTHIWVRSSVFETTAIILAKKTGAKLICEMNTPFYYEWCITRQLPLKRQVEKWEKKLLITVDYIYVVSENLKNMYIRHYGIDAKKIVVIPNGYDKELYADWESEYQDIRCNIRHKEKLDGKFVITFIGSLKIWHGIKRFCEIAKALEKEENIHFMVIGDGEMRTTIENYILHHKNMSFTGKLDYNTMKNYIYASDLGIMPYTINQDFYFSPLKMYDMIGGHLPFISSDVGQISEVCNRQLTSDFLTKENTTEEMVRCIKKIYNNSSIYQKMKDVIDQNQPEFTWDKRALLLLEKVR